MRRACLALFIGAWGAGACEPQAVRLFNGKSPVRDAAPPVVDVVPSTLPVADAVRPTSFTQPDCLSEACASCAAKPSNCVFGDTRWLCHPWTGECRAPCDPGGHAPQCPPDEQCHPDYGLCVDCASNDGCSSPTPVCDPASSRCVECTSNLQCLAANDVCLLPAQRCVQCRSDVDCLGVQETHCLQGDQRCVECIIDRDCADSSRPICSAQHECEEADDDESEDSED